MPTEGAAGAGRAEEATTSSLREEGKPSPVNREGVEAPDEDESTSPRRKGLGWKGFPRPMGMASHAVLEAIEIGEEGSESAVLEAPSGGGTPTGEASSGGRGGSPQASS